jgi:hypothetical protein
LSISVPRLEANDPGQKRPSTATATATRLLPEHADPDLAAVVDAWLRLPEAIKAGIVAMVEAAKG